jgi:hypothetical protein
MRSFVRLSAVSAVILGLGACQRDPYPAPAEAGVCYQAIFLKKGGELTGVKFNKLTENEPTIEKCAASLEGMRLRFLPMGGAEEIVGAYQGNYIFLVKEGIFRADKLDGTRYPMLVRLGNGQLGQPGSLPQTP